VEPVVCLMVVELSIFNFQLSTSSSHFQLLTCSFSLPGWKLTLEVGAEVGCVKGIRVCGICQRACGFFCSMLDDS
jgi:hypothetical protein